ncbi:MAG: hypothetical protein QM697_02070 [Lachnospiraceae bacterium]
MLLSVIMKPAGSLTIEAALVLPLFLFAMLSLLSLLSLLLFSVRVQEVLHQQTKYLAQQAYVEWETDVTALQTAFIEEIGISRLRGAPVKDGAAGLDFTKTDLSDREFIKLAIDYEAVLPYDLLNLFDYQFSQSCLMHTWIGYEKGLDGRAQKNKEEYVYITEDSEVYHRDRECSHIRLSIHETSSKEIENLRNNSGGKYHSCEVCHSSIGNEQLYITKDGEKYHNSLSCSGLKRTVTAIPLSETGNRRPCLRCGW